MNDDYVDDFIAIDSMLLRAPFAASMCECCLCVCRLRCLRAHGPSQMPLALEIRCDRWRSSAQKRKVKIISDEKLATIEMSNRWQNNVFPRQVNIWSSISFGAVVFLTSFFTVEKQICTPATITKHGRAIQLESFSVQMTLFLRSPNTKWSNKRCVFKNRHFSLSRVAERFAHLVCFSFASFFGGISANRIPLEFRWMIRWSVSNKKIGFAIFV